jgi:hypothetical protein
MKFLVLILTFFLLINFNNYAQDYEFLELPQNLQFYARDDNNKAIIPINGKVHSKQFDSIKIELFRNNVLYGFKSEKLIFAGDYAKFDLSVSINSELAEYKIAVYLDNSLIAIRDSLVCGDVYLINGQSNSHPYGNISYSNEYWRSFGKHTNTDDYDPADTTWGLANGWGWYSVYFGVGNWGIELQRLITSNYNIPVCILNGGSGGSSIEYNIPDLTNKMNLTTTYGRLLYRAVKAKLADNVKAIFWHQGESNSYNIHIYYEYYFDILYKTWKQDFKNLKKIYVFQIHPGCGGDNQREIREYQRNFPKKYSDICVMSTVGLDGHDGCHYYENGYNQMASWIFRLVARDFYGSNDTYSIKPPDLLRAYYLNIENTKIGIDFDEEIIMPDDLNGNSIKDYFYFDENYEILDNVVKNGSKSVILTLKSPNLYKKITYLPNLYYNKTYNIYEGPWLKNPRGIGVLSFYNIDIQPALQINTQPKSSDFCNSNSEVNLELTASGMIKYYKWQKFDESLNRWSDILNSDNSILKFNLNSTNLGAGKYRCIVTGLQSIQPDTIISNEAIIRLFKPVTNISLIVDSYKTQYCVYDSLKTIIIANGNLYKFYLQKEINGSFSNVDSGDCNYKNNFNYNRFLKPGDSGKYRIEGVIAVECGNNQVYSNTLDIKVNEGLEIAVKADSINVCKGNPLNPGIIVSGDVISFQWLKNDNFIDAGKNKTAITNELMIYNSVKSDSGFYQCLVRAKVCDSIKSIYSDKIYVKVNTSYYIIKEIVKNEYHIGDDADIKIETEDLNNVSFKWFKNDSKLNDNQKYSYCNSNSIKIKNLNKDDFNGYYYVITESNDCRDTSAYIYLKRAGTSVKITQQPTQIDICKGKNLEIGVDYTALNCDSLEFKWYFENKLICLSENIELNKADLKIFNIGNTLAGKYYLEIIALPGKIKVSSELIHVSINDKPAIISQSQDLIKVDEGKGFELNIEAESSDSINYQWYKDSDLMQGYTSQNLIKNISDLNDTGIYFCEIMNICGIIKSKEMKVEINPQNSVTQEITNKFEVLPNPAGDYIYIQPSERWQPSEVLGIQIFDILGICLSPAGGGIKGSERIDISNLSPGMYYIKIGNRVEKFVKI